MSSEWLSDIADKVEEELCFRIGCAAAEWTAAVFFEFGGGTAVVAELVPVESFAVEATGVVAAGAIAVRLTPLLKFAARSPKSMPFTIPL